MGFASAFPVGFTCSWPSSASYLWTQATPRPLPRAAWCGWAEVLGAESLPELLPNWIYSTLSGPRGALKPQYCHSLLNISHLFLIFLTAWYFKKQECGELWSFIALSKLKGRLIYLSYNTTYQVVVFFQIRMNFPLKTCFKVPRMNGVGYPSSENLVIKIITFVNYLEYVIRLFTNSPHRQRSSECFAKYNCRKTKL